MVLEGSLLLLVFDIQGDLYFKIQNCIQGYEDEPGMHAGGKEDLYEFQAYTKERVADLERDIKESFNLIQFLYEYFILKSIIV